MSFPPPGKGAPRNPSRLGSLASVGGGVLRKTGSVRKLSARALGAHDASLGKPGSQSPPISPASHPASVASTTASSTWTNTSRKSRRNPSFLGLQARGTPRPKARGWRRLVHVFTACVLIKRELGSARPSVTCGKHQAFAFMPATCQSCSHEYINDSNWYRCNSCPTDAPVDLCRVCFRAWTHPHHTFTEMSEAAFLQLGKTKRRWRGILRRAHHSGELRERVCSVADEAVRMLLDVLEELVRGRRGGDEVAAVAGWVLLTAAAPRIRGVLAEEGFSETTKRFNRRLDVADALRLRRQVIAATRKRHAVTDTAPLSDLSYTIDGLLYSFTISRKDAQLTADLPHIEPFSVSSLAFDGQKKPYSVTLAPLGCDVRLPAGLDAVAVLSGLKSIAVEFNIKHAIPDELVFDDPPFEPDVEPLDFPPLRRQSVGSMSPGLDARPMRCNSGSFRLHNGGGGQPGDRSSRRRSVFSDESEEDGRPAHRTRSFSGVSRQKSGKLAASNSVRHLPSNNRSIGNLADVKEPGRRRSTRDGLPAAASEAGLLSGMAVFRDDWHDRGSEPFFGLNDSGKSKRESQGEQTLKSSMKKHPSVDGLPTTSSPTARSAGGPQGPAGFKKRRSQSNSVLLRSLWDSTPPSHEVELLRQMMNGIVEGVRMLTDLLKDDTSSDDQAVSQFTGLDEVVKKLGAKHASWREEAICKEVSAQINEVITTAKEEAKKGRQDFSCQWAGDQGWESVLAASRLRSGRVGFEEVDMVCYATTRHETQAFGKKVIPLEKLHCRNPPKYTVITYTILRPSDGIQVGLVPPAAMLFDKKRGPAAEFGFSLRLDGALYLLGDAPDAPTITFPNLRIAQDDVITVKIRNCTETGIAKIFHNKALLHALPVGPGAANLVPHALFHNAARCKVRISVVEPPVPTDPLVHVRAPVLKIIRSLEATVMQSHDFRYRLPAPKGLVTIVFTDVQSSTKLWDKAADDMKAALGQHNQVIRQLIEKWRGYEVKTEGDAFMIAFQRTESALAWCLETQVELMNVDWPQAILRQEEACELLDARGNRTFRGLRVRMGFHIGEPECEQDPITGRMDYFGPMVNLAARIGGVGSGGEVIIGGAAFRQLYRSGALPDDNVDLNCHGSKSLKGITRNESLFSILPTELKGRRELWEVIRRGSITPMHKFEESPAITYGVHSNDSASNPVYCSPVLAKQASPKCLIPTKMSQISLTPSAYTDSSKRDEPRWVRTVWRQAAARALKDHHGKRRQEELTSAANAVITASRRAVDGRDGKAGAAKNPLERIASNKGMVKALQAYEAVLMAANENPTVFLKTERGEFNGLRGVIAGYEGTGNERVVVELEGRGQLVMGSNEVEKWSGADELALQILSKGGMSDDGLEWTRSLSEGCLRSHAAGMGIKISASKPNAPSECTESSVQALESSVVIEPIDTDSPDRNSNLLGRGSPGLDKSSLNKPSLDKPAPAVPQPLPAVDACRLSSGRRGSDERVSALPAAPFAEKANEAYGGPGAAPAAGSAHAAPQIERANATTQTEVKPAENEGPASPRALPDGRPLRSDASTATPQAHLQAAGSPASQAKPSPSDAAAPEPPGGEAPPQAVHPKPAATGGPDPAPQPAAPRNPGSENQASAGEPPRETSARTPTSPAQHNPAIPAESKETPRQASARTPSRAQKEPVISTESKETPRETSARTPTSPAQKEPVISTESKETPRETSARTPTSPAQKEPAIPEKSKEGQQADSNGGSSSVDAHIEERDEGAAAEALPVSRQHSPSILKRKRAEAAPSSPAEHSTRKPSVSWTNEQRTLLPPSTNSKPRQTSQHDSPAGTFSASPASSPMSRRLSVDQYQVQALQKESRNLLEKLCRAQEAREERDRQVAGLQAELDAARGRLQGEAARQQHAQSVHDELRLKFDRLQRDEQQRQLQAKLQALHDERSRDAGAPPSPGRTAPAGESPSNGGCQGCQRLAEMDARLARLDAEFEKAQMQIQALTAENREAASLHGTHDRRGLSASLNSVEPSRLLASGGIGHESRDMVRATSLSPLGSVTRDRVCSVTSPLTAPGPRLHEVASPTLESGKGLFHLLSPGSVAAAGSPRRQQQAPAAAPFSPSMAAEMALRGMLQPPPQSVHSYDSSARSSPSGRLAFDRFRAPPPLRAGSPQNGVPGKRSQRALPNLIRR
ncbi:Adenylate cyclase [Diplonema papillatum]|nr:Adenylate cyclase [Diplonema papillatum]